MRFERCLRGPVRKRKVEPSGTIFQELVDTISIARKSFPSTLYPAGPQMLLIVSGAFFRAVAALCASVRFPSPPLEVPVLRLQPCARSVADVARADPLGDNAFEAHAADVAKDGSAVAGDRLAQMDAVPASPCWPIGAWPRR